MEEGCPMHTPIRRRRFLSTAFGTAALAVAGTPFARRTAGQGRVARSSGARVRLGLNAYSFNEPLRAGTMTLDDLVDYCAQQGFDGLDATGYYFPGYPKVPDDAFLYPLNVGGRPPHFPLAFVIITFEMGVLFASFGAFFGTLGLGRLVRLTDEVQATPGFESATQDRFWVEVSLADPAARDPERTRALLIVTGARRVEVA